MAEYTPTRQLVGLIAWFAATFVAAALGALASVEAADFYASLERPPWAPPGWLFGPVWTVLFCLMAVAAWLVWRQGGHGTVVALRLYVAQLVFNALWSWLFFAWRSGGVAFVEVVALWLLVALTLIAFYRRHALAGLLLAPYLAWVSFAAVLNFAIWRLNPSALG